MMRQLKGWSPNLNMIFACVSYTHHEHNRKVTFYGIFIEPVLLMPACHMRLGVEFSTCRIDHTGSQKVSELDYVGVWA